MKFGKDFFKILQLVVAIMRLVARVFGDNDDITNDDTVNGDVTATANKIIKETPAANKKPDKPGK